MAREWKKNEITYLKRYADKRSVADLARRFGTDEGEVHAKLKELGLESGGGAAVASPALPDFEKALEAVQAGKWKKGAELLEKVIAGSDQAELTARARQYLEICRRKAEGDGAAEAVDPFLEAVYERNRGELERALELCRKQGSDERFVYLEAAVLAVQGDLAGAADRLGAAIEMNPKNKVHAYHDPDFEALRRDDDHAHLFQS